MFIKKTRFVFGLLQDILWKKNRTRAGGASSIIITSYDGMFSTTGYGIGVRYITATTVDSLHTHYTSLRPYIGVRIKCSWFLLFVYNIRYYILLFSPLPRLRLFRSNFLLCRRRKRLRNDNYYMYYITESFLADEHAPHRSSRLIHDSMAELGASKTTSPVITSLHKLGTSICHIYTYTYNMTRPKLIDRCTLQNDSSDIL